MEAIACPNCAAAMTHEMYEGAALDRCGQCGGVWLGQTAMGLIVERREEVFAKEVIADARTRAKTTGKTISPDERKRELKCPVCSSTIMPFVYNYSSGIVINRCMREHGIYLDKGELELVQAHAEFMDAAVAGEAKTYLTDQQIYHDAALDEADNAPREHVEREAQTIWDARQKKPLDKVLEWLGRKK
jgi:Zn-finger nucleic acid-binding protein